jgi:hypothetical protein
MGGKTKLIVLHLFTKYNIDKNELPIIFFRIIHKSRTYQFVKICNYFDNVRLSRRVILRVMAEARGFGTRTIDEVLRDMGTSLVEG